MIDLYLGGRAIDGTIAHGKLQKDNAIIYENYEKEVRMQHEFHKDNIILLVDGRADGIINEKGNIIIEEIKSTYMDLSYLYEDYNLLTLGSRKVLWVYLLYR